MEHGRWNVEHRMGSSQALGAPGWMSNKGGTVRDLGQVKKVVSEILFVGRSVTD